MKKVAEIEYCKKLAIVPLRFRPFEVLRYLDPSHFDNIESAQLEFGLYTVGKEQIIGVAHVSRGKVVRVAMLPSPKMLPIEAVDNEEVKELVSMACEELAKTVERGPNLPLPLSDFLGAIQNEYTQNKRASNVCYTMYIPFVRCWAVCCDFDVGMPCWWVCPGSIKPFSR